MLADSLKDEPLNGYQLISQIAERSGGAWKPSPGSVYPTISQLEDEGLIEGDDDFGLLANDDFPGRHFSAWSPELLNT